MCAGKRGQLSWSRSLFGQVLEEFGVGLGSKEAITLSEFTTYASIFSFKCVWAEGVQIAA